MSDRMRILQAIGQADEKDLLDAEQSMGFLDERHTAVIHRKKVLRTVLIAAVLSALFIGMAFSTGLFGLIERIVPGRNPRESLNLIPSPEVGEMAETAPQSGFIPPYGHKDSPEALAYAEYMELFLEYMAHDRSSESEPEGDLLPNDEELEKIKSIYFVFNQKMTAELLDIADKYGLELYADMIYPKSTEEFYTLAGTEPFFLPEGDDSRIVCDYIFEDGAFMCEGWLNIEGGNGMRRYGATGIEYSLIRGMPGYLYPFLRYVEEPEAYQEWSYVTARGASVSIAWRTGEPFPNPTRENAENTFDHVYVFYEENQRTISLNCTVYDGMSVERAQAIADCFDFSAACQGIPQVLSAIE